jgi:hypothetical protein
MSPLLICLLIFTIDSVTQRLVRRILDLLLFSISSPWCLPVAIYKTGNSVTAGMGRKQKVDFEDVIEDDTQKDDDEEEKEDTDTIDAKKDKLIKVKARPSKVTKKKPVKKKK